MSDFKNIPTHSYESLAPIMAQLIDNTPKNDTFDVISLLGGHGIGKTQFPKDLGYALGIPVIAETMSGKEPTDIIGNPYNAKTPEGDNITKLAPPSWFNRFETCNEEEDIRSDEWCEALKKLFKDVPADRLPQRILVMDEYNRVPPDTFGPMMNMVLTGEHHGVKMKYRTLIVLCGNITTGQDDYNVNELDPAQKDRIREVLIKPTLKGWVRFAKKLVHPGLLTFVKSHQKEINAWSPDGKISLRTITRLGMRLKNMDDETFEKYGLDVISLFVPKTSSNKIFKEICSYNKSVSSEDILKNYDNIQDKVKAMVKKRDLAILESIVDNLPDIIKLVDKEEDDKNKKLIQENIVKFIHDIPGPLIYRFIKNVKPLATGSNKTAFEVVRQAARSPQLAKVIRKVTQTSAQVENV